MARPSANDELLDAIREDECAEIVEKLRAAVRSGGEQ